MQRRDLLVVSVGAFVASALRGVTFGQLAYRVNDGSAPRPSSASWQTALQMTFAGTTTMRNAYPNVGS
jgi:hypothetical protein